MLSMRRVTDDDLRDTAERGMQHPLRFSHAGTGDSIAEEDEDMFAGMSAAERTEYIEFLNRAGFSKKGITQTKRNGKDTQNGDAAGFDATYRSIADHIVEASDPDLSREREPLYPWWGFAHTRYAIEDQLNSENG